MAHDVARSPIAGARAPVAASFTAKPARAGVRALAFAGATGVGVGLSAIALLALCLRTYGKPLDGALLYIGAATSIASYAIDRVWDTEPRTRRSPAAKVAVLALLVSALVVAALTHHSGAGALALSFPIAVAAYALPFLPGPYRRIKDIPFAKNAYTAACWGGLALLAAADGDAPWGARLAMWAFIAAKVFVAAIAADLKDRDADRARGIRTFVTELGLSRAILLVQWANGAAALSTVALVVGGILPGFLLVAEVPSLLMAVAMQRPRLRAGDPGAAAACAVLFELAHATAWPLVELIRTVVR